MTSIERRLSCREGEDEAYQFTLDPSFEPRVTVRIARRGDEIVLEHQVHGFFRRDDPRRGAKVRQLTTEDWDRLRSAVEWSAFWERPTYYRPFIGLDGTDWTVEGCREGTYHMITRWSPRSGPVRELGEVFSAIAGWPVPQEKIY
jgi:hypothetical protein